MYRLFLKIYIKSITWDIHYFSWFSWLTLLLLSIFIPAKIVISLWNIIYNFFSYFTPNPKFIKKIKLFSLSMVLCSARLVQFGRDAALVQWDEGRKNGVRSRVRTLAVRWCYLWTLTWWEIPQYWHSKQLITIFLTTQFKHPIEQKWQKPASLCEKIQKISHKICTSKNLKNIYLTSFLMKIRSLAELYTFLKRTNFRRLLPKCRSS